MKQNYRFILFISLSVVVLLLHISRNWTITSTSPQAIDAIASEKNLSATALSEIKADKPVPKYIFKYRNGQLEDWSNNKTPAPSRPDTLKPGLVQLNNGIYFFSSRHIDGDRFVYLKPIQLFASVRNKYLDQENHFPGEISLEPKAGLEKLDYTDQAVYFRPKQLSLSSLDLFSPEHYASSQLNNSIGAILLHLIWLISLMGLLQQLQWKKGYSQQIGLLSLIVSTLVINYLLRSLIFDSTLSVNPFNIVNLEWIDMAVPVLILLLSFLFLYSFRFLLIEELAEKKNNWISFSIWITYVFAATCLLNYSLLECNWPLIAIAPVILLRQRLTVSFKYFLASLAFSLAVLFIISHHDGIRTKEEQALIAEKLVNHDDPIIEYLIDEKIPNLETLAKNDPTAQKDPISFLNNNLFTGYLSGYKLVLPDSSSRINANGFGFRFLDQDYLFTSGYAATGFGFPQLLANREFSDFESKGYSTARFVHGKLVQTSGSFPYTREISFHRDGFEDWHGFHHLIRPAGTETFVVSYPIRPWYYFFSFGALVLVISSLALVIMTRSYKISTQTFQQRTRWASLSLLALAGIAFGTFACYYLFDQFNQKNNQILAEKMESVKLHLTRESELVGFKSNTILAAKLASLSDVLFTDISIYSKEGQLVATSQPDIFNKGLLSQNMLPRAYRAMVNDHANLILTNEHIGKLYFLSAYAPLTDENNHVVAYINLPYFAKQIELNNQLSNFLASVIAVWVVLTFLGFLFALFLANRITKPLKEVREKLQQLDLKEQGQFIEYRSNDEVGDLVTAYNLKVKELLEKAEALAKSERESAWREMAKQVAHEIKNPLTPIKLNAQLLQRSMESGAVDLKERVDRFVTGLIDQINTLTKIANEFSNYAALPKAVEEDFDLSELITSAASIMSDSNVLLHLNIRENTLVRADRSLMTRVVNNLLKNAIQATEEKKFDLTEKAEITLKLLADHENACFTVTDNGIGINPDQQDKIFTPSFTTKTTGMGLGLAMVKQIVEQAGGNIFYESTIGKGTTFTVILPLKNQT